jgi:Kef-type K+ transport system membrane component KefB
LDDALSVVIYGFALVLAKSLLMQESGMQADASYFSQLGWPLLEIGGACLLGWYGGKFYFELARRVRKRGDLLILTMGYIVLICGICQWLHLSLILANMGIGVYLVNSGKEGLLRRVREMVSDAMPLVFVLFFALAGAHLDIHSLTAVGAVSVLYVLSRIVGKAGGAWLGAAVGGADPVIRKNLGLAILSQAGLAVGLSLIVFSELSAMSNVPRAMEVGQLVLTTITATTIIFEILGPILVRRSLKRAGELGPAVA